MNLRAQQEPNQRIRFQIFQAVDHARGVQFGSGEAGMRVLVAKQGRHLLRTERIIPPRDDVVQVDERGAFGAGHIGGPLRVGIRVAGDFSVLPELSGNGRTDDRYGALRARAGDEAAEVPAVGVYDLVLVRDGIVDLASLVAGARNCAAGATWVVEWSAVVMTELHHDEVAGLQPDP